MDSSTCSCLVWPASFAGDALCFPVCFSGFFIKNKVSIGVWTYICPSVRFHWSMCLFLCWDHAVSAYSSSVVQFEMKDGDTSRSSFLTQDCFSYPDFCASIWSWNFSFKVLKNCIGVLIGMALNLWIAFGRMGHFYYINTTVPWAWEIVSSSDIFSSFFLQWLEVLLSYQSFTYLVRVNSRYFLRYSWRYCSPDFFLSTFFICI